MAIHEFCLNFTGTTHDHTILSQGKGDSQDEINECSTIAILRRHPMYDCLVLVKKYRSCLDDYSLEFPTDKIINESNSNTEMDENRTPVDDLMSPVNGVKNCARRRLVSKFLDGDDPIFQSCCANTGAPEQQHSHLSGEASPPPSASCPHPFAQQTDDKGDRCELVHVPINGLLDRLMNYTRSGLAVDSRVYAFAMGLKTAERILTTSSMKELQETPI